MALRSLVFLLCLGLIQAKLLQLSCKQIRQYVDGHNARRLLLARGQVPGQPAATNMNFMVWDEELAAKAAKWASHNNFQHNPDKSIASKRFMTGENLYTSSTTAKGVPFVVEDALRSWWDEHYDYSFKKVATSDFGGSVAVGHYTQMAWADTTKVGCAVSQYQKGGWNTFLIVCNYGPAGNFIGRTPYTQGKAAGKLTCSGKCNHMYGTKC